MKDSIELAYTTAKQKYETLGVDVEAALETLKNVSISMHCWQGDDVGGFETPDAELSGGGIQATGNYPGKAKTLEELRQDYEKAFSLIPGKMRANIHAIYGDFQGEKIGRDQIEPRHFQSWIDWAKKLGIGIDFNCTLFSHPLAEDGFTLSSKDQKIRGFWIEHCKRCRKISAEIGKQLGTPVIHNIWIPDGTKDIPIDREGHRKLLTDSLDELLQPDYDPSHMRDTVEGKLFGIGSEAYVVGSNDFYLAYAISRKICLTMDTGHYHPTESVADKVSAVLPFTGELMLHVSRGIRWDSDHVVIRNDELESLMEEIVKIDRWDNIHIGLDFFDASINRIAAWVIGTRATLKALLKALLMPWKKLHEYEEAGKPHCRLGLLEDMKTMPLGAIWDKYCYSTNCSLDIDWLNIVEQYEKEVLLHR